jgi:hypothetical protein
MRVYLQDVPGVIRDLNWVCLPEAMGTGAGPPQAGGPAEALPVLAGEGFEFSENGLVGEKRQFYFVACYVEERRAWSEDLLYNLVQEIFQAGAGNMDKGEDVGQDSDRDGLGGRGHVGERGDLVE